MLTNQTQTPSPAPLRRRDAALGVGIAILAAAALIAALSALAALAPPAAAQDRLRLAREDASPGKIFYKARRSATYAFELTGRRARDVRVKVVRRKSGKVMRSWTRRNVEPGDLKRVRWDGSRSNGSAVAGGNYVFRVREQGGGGADHTDARGRGSVEARNHKFPVRGGHSYGDGFGAGRGHQGQDVFAKCGTKLVAARAGRVQVRGRHSAAGNYVVIDGRRSKLDYVYMHLRGKPDVRRGQRVRTGQPIGKVGASGNASGCHLHFELWSSPGWYEGGSAKPSVTRKLRMWDRHS